MRNPPVVRALFAYLANVEDSVVPARKHGGFGKGKGEENMCV